MTRGRLRLAVMRLFPTVNDAMEVARTAEEVGLDAVGIGDSPLLYPDLHVTMAAVLAHTRHIQVTPCVTNLVTRHWSVHAGVSRAFAELAPNRTWITLATGNSAVRMSGLRPHRLGDLERSIHSLRQAAGPDQRIIVAAAGPRASEAAGLAGDGILIGSGTDIEVLTTLIQRAQSARSASAPPLERWLHIPFNLARSNRPDDVAAAEDEILNATIGFSRPALMANPEREGVPSSLRRALDRFLEAYDFASHGKAGAVQPNVAILASQPDAAAIRRFLLDRFAIVGAADHVVARLASLAGAGDLDGVSLSIPVEDPSSLVRRIGTEVAPLLRR